MKAPRKAKNEACGGGRRGAKKLLGIIRERALVSSILGSWFYFVLSAATIVFIVIMAEIVAASAQPETAAARLLLFLGSIIAPNALLGWWVVKCVGRLTRYRDRTADVLRGLVLKATPQLERNEELLAEIESLRPELALKGREIVQQKLEDLVKEFGLSEWIASISDC